MCVCLTSSILLFSSCTHSGQEDAQIINDSLIEREPKVIPLSEISLKGKWVSKDNSSYPILLFKGKSTVFIQASLIPFASSYERDEEFIRVRTDQTVVGPYLLFEIVSEDSMVGYGFADGVWIREK